MTEIENERHPFKFLFKLALFIGVLAAATKFIASKKDEFYGLTESEAREKFQSKLGPRIGEDKAADVADQVIPKLKEKGVVKSDPVESAMNDAKDAVTNAADAVKGKASDAADTAKDSVSKAADTVKGKAGDAAGAAKDAIEDMTSD